MNERGTVKPNDKTIPCGQLAPATPGRSTKEKNNKSCFANPTGHGKSKLKPISMQWLALASDRQPLGGPMDPGARWHVARSFSIAVRRRHFHHAYKPHRIVVNILPGPKSPPLPIFIKGSQCLKGSPIFMGCPRGEEETRCCHLSALYVPALTTTSPAFIATGISPGPQVYPIFGFPPCKTM